MFYLKEKWGSYTRARKRFAIVSPVGGGETAANLLILRRRNEGAVSKQSRKTKARHSKVPGLCCILELMKKQVMELRISSEEGCLLRVNRSIQAEGIFAMTKEDMRFRRFLTRGTYNVTVEWLLLCFAYNVLKLDHKAKAGRLGTHLIIPKPKVA